MKHIIQALTGTAFGALLLFTPPAALAGNPSVFSGIYPTECTGASVAISYWLGTSGPSYQDSLQVPVGCDVNSDEVELEMYRIKDQARAFCVDFLRVGNPSIPDDYWECVNVGNSLAAGVYGTRSALIELIPDEVNVQIPYGDLGNVILDSWPFYMSTTHEHAPVLDIPSLTGKHHPVKGLIVTSATYNPPLSATTYESVQGVVSGWGYFNAAGIGIEPLGGQAGADYFAGCFNAAAATLTGAVNGEAISATFGANASFNCVGGNGAGAFWLNLGVTYSGGFASPVE